ncbi:HK97 gp10 family phage protein [Sphingomonas aliaeris]|nr:HK97 gp10 family phage protein [Sphingomonas aliaeris]
MASLKGRTEVARFITGLPAEIETKLLRGAARAAATVVADDAKQRSISAEVSAAVKVRTAAKRGDTTVVAKVQVKGPGSYIAPWLEYGTLPHYISVADEQRGGKSVRRINRLGGAKALAINGKFAKTVYHPGTDAHPFLRPALDANESEAIAAAQGYINSRVTPAGIVGTAENGDDE